MHEYSENERRMFNALGFGHLIERLDPMPLYTMAAMKAFENNLQGPHVEALRRACKAIHSCKIYRMCDEFESLIDFEDNNEQSN